MIRYQWELADELATNSWAAALAGVLPQEFFYISLCGGLGAGKTHTVRAVLRALGEQGPVRSPTYTLLEEYGLANRKIVHLDLYRLAEASELEYLGLRDMLGEKLQMFIEWADKAAGELPPPDVKITLSINALGGRSAVVEGLSPAGCECVAAWVQNSP
ncbi:MAG: tRNA (adenosine(37)-N6)-threonylcarbamoyltransferase complex ATPase subunit type 1 TsaE [Oceanococcus sp.]